MPIGSGPGAASELLHLPHHVVAEIAEHAGRHRRQRVRQRDPAFADEGAHRFERRRGERRECLWIALGLPVYLGQFAVGAENHIGLQPDD